jgi:hypothetical protein
MKIKKRDPFVLELKKETIKRLENNNPSSKMKDLILKKN